MCVEVRRRRFLMRRGRVDRKACSSIGDFLRGLEEVEVDCFLRIRVPRGRDGEGSSEVVMSSMSSSDAAMLCGPGLGVYNKNIYKGKIYRFCGRWICGGGRWVNYGCTCKSFFLLLLTISQPCRRNFDKSWSRRNPIRRRSSRSSRPSDSRIGLLSIRLLLNITLRNRH